MAKQDKEVSWEHVTHASGLGRFVTTDPLSLVPAEFAELLRDRPPDADGDPSGSQWLAQLPRLIADLLTEWDLTCDGEAMFGYAALVLPVRRAGSNAEAAALKVGWPHPEARDEARTLSTWSGKSAVRLLAADPRRWALLLERLETRDLSSVSVLDHCHELGRLARTLDRPAPPWASRWSDALAELESDIARVLGTPRAAVFPRRLLTQAQQIAQRLRTHTDVDARLVHTDLHQHNALWRPDPGEWVAIDPKPMAGHPAVALAPVLWNVWEAAEAAHDVRTHLNLRVEIWCEAAGVDPDLAREFALVRLVRNAVWQLHSPGAVGPDLTRMVTICKAMLPG